MDWRMETVTIVYRLHVYVATIYIYTTIRYLLIYAEAFNLSYNENVLVQILRLTSSVGSIIALAATYFGSKVLKVLLPPRGTGIVPKSNYSTTECIRKRCTLLRVPEACVKFRRQSSLPNGITRKGQPSQIDAQEKGSFKALKIPRLYLLSGASCRLIA